MDSRIPQENNSFVLCRKESYDFRMLIIIVDDDEKICLHLQKGLVDYGTTVFSTKYREASEMIRNLSPDLLICDYYFPDGNGHELISEFKIINSANKAILISGSATKAMAIDSIRLNVNALLEKPFSLTDLKSVIDDLFQNKSKAVVLNDKDNVVQIKDSSFQLTSTEYKIFKLLYQNQHKRLSRKEISNVVWGNAALSDNTIDTHLGNIKKKMGSHHGALNNIKGLGYILDFDRNSFCG